MRRAHKSLKSMSHGQLRHTLARRILAVALEQSQQNPWLIEQQLATRFNVSRTPIREALSELARLGLVEHHPNRGVKLLAFGPSEFRGIMAVRAVLEAEAARLASSHLGQADLAGWRRRAEQLQSEKTSDQAWSQRVWQADRELSQRIHDACGNVRLAREAQRYTELVDMTHDLIDGFALDEDEVLDGHLRIISAMQQQDAVAAGRAMHQHIMSPCVRAEMPTPAMGPVAGASPVRSGQHVAILMQPQGGDQWASKEIFLYRLARYAMQILKAQGVEGRMYWPVNEQNDDLSILPFECPRLVEEIDKGHVIGVIAESVHAHDDWLEAGQRAGIPLAGTGKRLTADVRIDHQQAVADGVDRLVSLGASRLALLSWTKPGSLHQPDWRSMFRQTLESRNLPFDPNWCITDHWPLRHSDGWEGFREIWSAGKVKPDGILIGDDFLYIEAANAMLELGINIPQQLHVVTTANAGVPLACPFPTNVLLLDTKTYAAKFVRLMLRPNPADESGKDLMTMAYRMLPGQHSLATSSESSLALGMPARLS